MTTAVRQSLRLLRRLLLATLPLLWGCDAVDEQRAAAGGRSALVIVDMQYDFMPGGALAAPGGDEITPLINSLQPRFDLVVATQDWHPPGHGSFASAHPGKRPGEIIDLNGVEQVLWPDHAVQGSRGAQLADALDKDRIARVFRKGTDPEVDSYSGFFDNGRRGDTGLHDYLQQSGVARVFVVGLALDYCVSFTALDANRLGYETAVIVDASRAVNLRPGDADATVRALADAGIAVLHSDALPIEK